MKLKLLLLLLVFICTFIIPAQLKKHDRHPKHGEKDHKDKKDKHGKKHGRGRGRVEHLMIEYEDESSDDDDDEDEERGEWLFRLQNVRGQCNPNPCLNNGVCEEKRDKFKCRCPKPFKGRKCEKTKKVCKKKTCGFGQCVLTSSPPYYECKCIPPFKPPDCRKISPCEWNPCLNEGTCEIDGKDFECVCKPGFSGRFCQVSPDDCYEENGESYRGMVSETEEGEDCLFWNSHFLLGRGTNPFSIFEDIDGLGSHNYCRNPDGDSKPWCFIRLGRKTQWDHCDVRKCSSEGTTVPPEPQPMTVDPTIIWSTVPFPLSPTTETDISRSPTPETEISRSPTPETEISRSPTPETDIYESPTPETDISGSPTTPHDDETETTFPDGSITPGSTTSESPEEYTTIDAITRIPTPEIVTIDVIAEHITPTVVGQFATCGKPKPRKQIHRVYGGAKAIPGGQPWQASIQVRPKGTSHSFRHVCGGTLIKPCWVLTAGHCLDNKNDFRVVLGSEKLTKLEPFQQTLEVVETIIHEEYREEHSAVYNDIALLKIKDKNGTCAEESQNVKTVCLPTKNFPDGTECRIAGWGATPESLYGSSHLLDADVLLISQEVCASPDVYGDTIDKNMVCAGYLEGGVDSCQGDSGGPLTCTENETHYIYGIVSWGDRCGLKNKPGVYTRVTGFVDWINAKTASG